MGAHVIRTLADCLVERRARVVELPLPVESNAEAAVQHGMARAEQKCLTIGALRLGVTRLPAETEREIRPRLHVTGRERERHAQLLFGFRVATLGAEGDPELAVEFRVVRPQGHRTRKRRRRGRVVAVRTERQSMARVKFRIVGPQRECIRPCLGLVAPTALALIRRREHAIRRDPVRAQAHGLAQRAHGVFGAPQALQRDAKMVVGFGGRRIDSDGRTRLRPRSCDDTHIAE